MSRRAAHPPAASITLALTASIAAAQPAPDPGVLALPSGMILNDLRGTYRETPIEQRLSITVKTAEGDKQTSEVRLRCVPGRNADIGGECRLVLQLGDLILWNTDAAIRAVNARSPTLYFEAPIKDGDAAKTISEALPPLPIPQIQLALGRDDALKDPTPYTTAVKWSDAALAVQANPRAIMTGKGDRCEVALTIDAAQSCLREMKATARDGGLEIRMVCSEPKAGEPSLTPPGIEGRKQVDRLRDLDPVVTEPTAPPAAR